MKFCPSCGTMLREVRKEGVIRLMCPKCGHSEPKQGAATLAAAPAAQRRPKPTSGGIVDYGGDEDESRPKTRAACPKCGNMEAYWWMQQTRSGDEASTRFFRCTKCGHTWREYE